MANTTRFNVPYPNNETLAQWADMLYRRLGRTGPLPIQGYLVAELGTAPLLDPTEYGSIATPIAGRSERPWTSIIFVIDEVGGPVLAFSDGTNWRRVTDRAIVA